MITKEGKRFRYLFIGDEEEGVGRMALIHLDNAEGLKSELEVFSVYPTQTSLEETRYAQYFPTTTLDRGGLITFNIPATEKEYIDPRKVFLYMNIRILDENGAAPAKLTAHNDSAIAPKFFVYPINYFHATCLKNMDVYVNNKNVSANNMLYAYRAYFEALLSYSRTLKQEQFVVSVQEDTK